jgi:hypothetical protein
MSIDEGSGVLLEGASHCAITGNTFTGLSTAAVWSTAPCRALLVTNNLVTDCGRKLAKTAPMLHLPGAKASLIKDNLTEP